MCQSKFAIFLLLCLPVSKALLPRGDLRGIGWSSRIATKIGSQVDLLDFDFSSTRSWDKFYQDVEEVYEWHSSLSFDDISQHVVDDGRILMIGCGNSQLPSTFSGQEVDLLDSSRVCMDELELRYADEPHFNFICGDVFELKDLIRGRRYKTVLDKGLMDAFLCGEDWDATVRKLLELMVTLLDGSYVLVSYKLPPSTQAYLRQVGDAVGLRWAFDVKGSNERVGISIARRSEA